MSTAVTDIENRAFGRLTELRPYLEEAVQLLRVIDTLEEPPGEPASSAPQPPATASGRAVPGSNKRRILATVLETPGIRPAEVAQATGLKRSVVASTMCRMKNTGELEPDGPGARVPKSRQRSVAALLAS